MVHCLTFFHIFVHALQYSHLDSSIGKRYAEKLTFEFFEFFLVLSCLLAFSLQFQPFIVRSTSLCVEVVLLVQIVGTNVFRAVGVLAEEIELLDIVAPYRTVLNRVAVADCDTQRCPIVGNPFGLAVHKVFE